MSSVDLAKLRTDLDTATPHQTPTWADGLTVAEFETLCARAEQIAADGRSLRAVMRKPNS